MVQLNYDDNAASVFGVTLLLFYLVPSSIYILYRISTFQRRLKAAEEAAAGGLKPRTELERKKLQSLVAKAEKPVLWSRGFKTFVMITGAAALLFLYLLLRSSGHAELAQYDPYEVSHRRLSVLPTWQFAEKRALVLLPFAADHCKTTLPLPGCRCHCP